MDSMRSLNRSLPGPREQPLVEDINGAFKKAAISVTNLYKSAIRGEKQARLAGYQDALDDILSFLDRQNLGLQDGEGWLVRQWATGLLDDRSTTIPTTNNKDEHPASDSEEEKEVEKEKSPSPAPRESSSPLHQPMERQVEPARQSERQPEQEKAPPPIPSTEFTFQSTHNYPKDVEMQIEAAAASVPPLQTMTKREVSPRATRSRKPVKQKSFPTKVFGSGGGSKRKMPFGEFFDISDLTDGNKDDGKRPATRRKLA